MKSMVDILNFVTPSIGTSGWAAFFQSSASSDEIAIRQVLDEKVKVAPFAPRQIAKGSAALGVRCALT